MQTQHVVTTFEEEIARSGRLAYTNVGFSMRPLLREGRDIMVIERFDPTALRKYQAVLFIRPGKKGRGAYVLHRILKILPDGRYWIVGDNCTSGETVAPEHFIGVLTAVKRGKRTIREADFGYRLYVALWCAPYPMRFLILRIKNFCRRVLSGIKRRVIRKNEQKRPE